MARPIIIREPERGVTTLGSLKAGTLFETQDRYGIKMDPGAVLFSPGGVPYVAPISMSRSVVRALPVGATFTLQQG